MTFISTFSETNDLKRSYGGWHMSVEIYICDLKPEVQEQVLSELNLSSAKEGNYDLFPLFVVEKQE